MTNTSKLLAPALIALGVFAFVPARAEVIKGAPDVPAKGMPDVPTKGMPDMPPAPPQPPQGGGRGDVVDYHQITCVVNGRVFQVRSVRECYRGSQYRDGGIGGGGGYGLGGGYAYKFNRGQGYGASYAYGGGYGYEGYGYAPQPGVLYYRPASRAAVMQIERRRSEAQYGYGGGYGYEGMGYGEEDGYVRSHKHGRKVHNSRSLRRLGGGYGFGQGEMQGFSYNPGFMLHYGPTISKDGGY